MTKKTLFYTILALLTLSLIGCGDNAQDKAAKSLKQSLDRSLEMATRDGDYLKAYQQLTSAIRTVPADTPLRNAALLAAGNLSIHAANDKITAFNDAPLAVTKAIEKVSAFLPDLIDTEHRIERLNNLYKASEKEIEDLKRIIEGSPEKQGLMGKLNEYRSEMTKLNNQRNELNTQADKQQTQVDDMQNKANEIFTQAANANLSTERQVFLEQQGLDIMKERKDSLFELQMLRDKISLVEREIELVTPMITRLQNDVADILNRVENVKQARQQSELTRQITDARSMRTAQVDKLKTLTAALTDKFDAYTSRVDDINTHFTAALGEYEKVRSRDMRDTTENHQAQAQYQQALFLSGVADFARVSANRVKAKSLVLSDDTDQILLDAADQVQKKADAWREMTQTTYQAALDMYNQLNQGMSGTAAFDCSVAKGFVLAAASMRDFMNTYEPFSWDEAMQARLDQAVEQAKQCDPKFETSTAGRFHSGNLEYLPVLEVDTNTYFEQKREEYQQRISQLATLDFEESKIQAQKLLDELQQLREIDPEAYETAMSPLVTQLETEIAKEEADEVDTPGMTGGFAGPGEPNGF